MKRSFPEVQGWIVDRMSRLTGMPPDEVNPTQPILCHGLDSVAVVALFTDLEAWLGVKMRGNPLEDYPTIESLAHFLADQQTVHSS